MNGNFTSQSELNEKILSYINDRVLSFGIKNEGSDQLTYISRRYEHRLIELLNPSLRQITNQKIFIVIIIKN